MEQRPTPDKRPNRLLDATSRQPPKPPSHFEKRRQLAASARPEAAVASSTPWNGGLHACFWARRTCWKVLCEFKLAPAFRESKRPSSLGDSRISHSEPSVCATLALLVGRVLRRRTPRVPRGFAGPQLELWAVCGDPDTTTGTIWLGFTSASRVTAPCVFHRHSERRHAGGAISG